MFDINSGSVANQHCQNREGQNLPHPLIQKCGENGDLRQFNSYYVVKDLGVKARRLHHEKQLEEFACRSAFAIDRERVVNSSAFRRLQYKTQVFVNHQGDHYRTRLTHSLEVAQIARFLSSALNLNQDLAEIIALAHDLGHPPFGHAGEDALNQKMQPFGGFSHNVFGLKILTKIETRFIEFEGLNLTWEVLEGLVKHNGPIDPAKLSSKDGCEYISSFNSKFDLALDCYPSLEAQVAAIADDIAYNNHDIEDGLRAGLFEIEDLFELPLIGEIYQKILRDYGKIKRELLVGQAKREIVSAMIYDVISKTKENLAQIAAQPNFALGALAPVEFSLEMSENHRRIKAFLLEKMYRHPQVNRMSAKGKQIVSELFDFYLKNPSCLPLEVFGTNKETRNDEDLRLEILISDYIAGMTDRFAIKEYQELL